MVPEAGLGFDVETQVVSMKVPGSASDALADTIRQAPELFDPVAFVALLAED